MLRTWCICTVWHTWYIPYILHIYCIYHSYVQYRHIVHIRRMLCNIYIYQQYRGSTTCLIYLHILRIYMRIYCVHTAYIWRMFPNICICGIYVCIIGLFYNMLDMLDMLHIYMRIYSAYHRISGACFRTCVCMCIYVHNRCSAHTWYTWYTTYIYAYILRIYYVYLTYAANMCICMLYDILDMLDILRIYCIYTTYILRVSGVCLLTYRSRDLYIYIGVVLHILDMLDILRIYMRIYYAHHRISGVCSEHMYMWYICVYNRVVLQHAGYAWHAAYIHAYIFRISSHIWRMFPNIGIWCMCMYVHNRGSTTCLIYLHILRIYMRIYCVHTAYI